MTINNGAVIQNTYSNVADAMLRIGDIIDRSQERKERQSERQQALAERNAEKAERNAQIQQAKAERLQALAERHDEREASYAGTLASDYVKNQWHGTDAQDQKTGKVVHSPGIVDLGYADLERDKSSVGQKTDELLKSVREQDFYRNLSPNQKRLFDRDWIFKENELRRASANRQGQLVAQRAKDHDEQTMAFNNRIVAEKFGYADGSYEMARYRMSVQNFGIMMGTSIKNSDLLGNPATTFDDIAKAEKWSDEETSFQRKRFDTLVHTYDRMRVDALIQAGANNLSIGVYNPHQALAEAARLTNALNGNTHGIDEKTGQKKVGKDKDGKDLPPAKQWITDQERNAYLVKIEDASKKLQSTIVANAKAEDDKASAKDKDDFTKEVLRCISPGEAPALSRLERRDAILKNESLSPTSKLAAISRWDAWYAAREKENEERLAARDKTGYLTFEQVNGEKQTVWVSPTGWGKTGSTGYDLINAEAVARDPVKALVNAETLKATGNISREDYVNTVTTATALQNSNIVDAVKKVLGGDFLKLIDANLPQKGVTPGDEFAKPLYYAMRNGEQKLFTTQERLNLMRDIGWMKAHGYSDEQINTAVQEVVNPKVERYYDMLMEQRLADPSYVNRFKTLGNFDERVSASVGTVTGKPVNKVR